MPLGTSQVWNFNFTDPVTGQAFPIAGAQWEYVARDASGNAVIILTTATTAQGLLSVTSTSSLSQVQMDLYPAATSSLTPAAYSHALWMNPGGINAYAWFTGQLQVEASARP